MRNFTTNFVANEIESEDELHAAIWQASRRAAIEAAAQVADEYEKRQAKPAYSGDREAAIAAEQSRQIKEAIRALKEAE